MASADLLLATQAAIPQTAPRSMVATHHLPTPSLRPYVRTFLLIESGTGTVNRLLPDTALVLAFRLKGRTEDLRSESGVLPAAALTGIPRAARLMAYAPGTAMLLTLFQEGGAAAFFGPALHALKGLTVPVEEVVPPDALAAVEDALDEARTDTERFRAVERFLLARLRPQRPDVLITEAVRRIKGAQGILRVRALAADLCISVDAFEKRFRAVTGTSPKHFASIVRLRALIAQGQADLSSLAFDGAFYDQSHLTAEFKRFTGLAPRQFFRQGPFW